MKSKAIKLNEGNQFNFGQEEVLKKIEERENNNWEKSLEKFIEKYFEYEETITFTRQEVCDKEGNLGEPTIHTRLQSFIKYPQLLQKLSKAIKSVKQGAIPEDDFLYYSFNDERKQLILHFYNSKQRLAVKSNISDHFYNGLKKKFANGYHFFLLLIRHFLIKKANFSEEELVNLAHVLNSL